jgi:hypothetical protein
LAGAKRHQPPFVGFEGVERASSCASAPQLVRVAQEGVCRRGCCRFIGSGPKFIGDSAINAPSLRRRGVMDGGLWRDQF